MWASWQWHSRYYSYTFLKYRSKPTKTNTFIIRWFLSPLSLEWTKKRACSWCWSNYEQQIWTTIWCGCRPAPPKNHCNLQMHRLGGERNGQKRCCNVKLELQGCQAGFAIKQYRLLQSRVRYGQKAIHRRQAPSWRISKTWWQMATDSGTKAPYYHEPSWKNTTIDEFLLGTAL